MRKIIMLMHVSLDGFVAGPNGEMNWIKIDDEMFEDVGKLTQHADTALYGRITFQMMESYWPTAAETPNPSKHTIEHSRWANESIKIVFSKTLTSTNWQHTVFISDDIPQQMEAFKKQPGKNALLIGSPGVSQVFIQHNLIDEYWLNVNPVILGEGIPLFADKSKQIDLELISQREYKPGVMGLHYQKKQSSTSSF
jgi:dihydrofolate reductase